MTFPSLRPPRSRRSGSALIIVLGILSILLVMSVTFSALVRTERGGTTNLKNSQIAREALQSALVQAMEAIEQSFDNPTNNWPVPCWPYPWIASAQEPGDDVAAFDSGAFSGLYYQSGHVEDGAPDAHVMFPGMSSFLTPAQVALVRSAKCGWSPLRASIAATSDGVIGRCAYVALDTTGYLDANVVHYDPDARAETLGEDPYTFKLPSASDNLTDYDGNRIPCSLTSPEQFASARTAAKSFLSFADLRHYCAAKDVDRTRDVKGKYPALNLEPPSNTTDPFPADLFCFSSLSLDELAPNGQPKIVLPGESGFKSKAECTKWGARALRAMAEIFARSRDSADPGYLGSNDKDVYTFYPQLAKSSQLKLSRARIATVSLLDSLDADARPGRNEKFDFSYWSQLPDFTGSNRLEVDGKNIVDEKPDSGMLLGEDSVCNFPATDSIPMIDRAFAYLCITQAVPHVASGVSIAAAGDSYIEYKGAIHFGAMALNLNRSENDVSDTYTLEMSLDVLEGSPANSVSKASGTDIKTAINYQAEGVDAVQWSFGGEAARSGALSSADATPKSTAVHGGTGDENRYIYYGCIGKTLPSYVVFGKEAHVGQSFAALDPNLLLAEITRKISLNVDYSDIAYGEICVPPISLKQADTKVGYTVQTALVAYGYYNYFTHGMTPTQVLYNAKQVAIDAMDDVIKYLNRQYMRFCNISKVKFTPLPWKTRVLTYKEYYEEIKADKGQEFVDAMDKFMKELHESDPGMDLRVYGNTVIQEMWKWMDDKSPCIVVYFGSLYSANIEMTGKTPMEKALLDAVEDAVEKVRPEAGRQIKTRMFYPYIADSSFMAVGGESTAGKFLKSQTGWMWEYSNGNYSDGNGTDAFGFSALPAGERNEDGYFENEGYYAKFWSSFEDLSLDAYFVKLYYNRESVRLNSTDKYSALSVRCVKD